MPLYEAISNSIDSIEECGDNIKDHTITINLLRGRSLLKESGHWEIDGFEVIDDGVGFTEKNMNSFREAYSQSKVKIGGKGIGRFTFLKVFSRVEIESVFEDAGSYLRRSFVFTIEDEIKEENPQSSKGERRTTVRAKGVNEKFKKNWPSDLNKIAHKIVEHFLIRFSSTYVPRIRINSPAGEGVSLNSVFDLIRMERIQSEQFVVDGYEFLAEIYRAHNGNSQNEIKLCALGREVSSGKLSNILIELPNALEGGDGKKYYLMALITGDYINKNVNQERTEVLFRKSAEIEEELPVEEERITKSSFYDNIASVLRRLLGKDLEITNKNKRAQIEEFISHKAPEYRSLLNDRYRIDIDQKIRPGLSERELDKELLGISRSIEESISDEAHHIAELMEHETYEEYKDKFKEISDKVTDFSKAKLASYVTHRRIILDLLSKSLKLRKEDDKYPLEKVIHKLIFPMGVDSRDIFFDQQNLWVIDERLSYHTILTSDKRIESIKGMSGVSKKEPDIFSVFYNTPVGVSEFTEGGTGGIVLIEFKRPGLDNYQKDPADQIIQRFREIAEGKVMDIDGRRINTLNVRFTGYLIADLTPSLKRNVYGRYHEVSDGEGYFHPLTGNNSGYIEIISYDKMVKNSLRQNRMLFDKLSLHKN